MLLNSRNTFLLFLLTVFLSCNFLEAQNIDSLKSSLNSVSLDSNRVRTLNKLAWNLRSIDPAAAMSYAEEAKSISEKISYAKGSGDAYNNIGVLHYRRGEYIEATKAHFQALSIREKIGDKEGLAISHINLGNIFGDQQNNQLALDHYLAAANILDEIHDKKRLPIIYLNISAVFLSEKKFEEGLPYCEKAKLASLEIQDSTILAEALNNIGVVKESENNFSAALDFYSQALKISEATHDKTEMVDNMTNIGNMNRMLNKTELAIEWHTKTEKLAREISYLEGLRILYSEFSKDYKALGKFEQALDYQIRYKQLSDSLFNDENTSRINELTDKWEKDRGEKNLLQQQEELAQQQEKGRLDKQRLWVIASGGFILLLFAAYVSYSNSRMKKANLLIKAQAEEIARKKKSEIG